MAIVATYQFEHGTVSINDDAYRTASPEELREREREMQRVAGEIMANAARRNRQKGNDIARTG